MPRPYRTHLDRLAGASKARHLNILLLIDAGELRSVVSSSSSSLPAERRASPPPPLHHRLHRPPPLNTTTSTATGAAASTPPHHLWSRCLDCSTATSTPPPAAELGSPTSSSLQFGMMWVNLGGFG
ncbi:hypothetical protein E2562_033649 [Oryza meyeriana var. granulata]|uniref:Uncharacterized protein n=1 Tax=Oryza meyeriana var. granulata TaxID=110450 RepID=A0A6G1CW19_9ORYZ|nr:hypothetical protein E2562_033649 [Oryza meyeriana var. granulata]